MNPTTQYQLALASRLAYESAAQLQDASAKLGFDSAVQHSVRNHSVTIVRRKESTTIAFRGTENAADWRSNLMLLPVRREWGWVHMGFARATEALWDSIESTLRECVSSNRELYFTGHSLGGAMAVIAALKAHFELDMTIAGIATFGQPPLAGTSTLESIKKAGLEDYPRIVNSVDVVVTGPFLPFYHAGSLRYFDSNGLLHQEFSWPRFFIDAARDGWHWRVAGQVKRHFMDGYVSLVASQLARTRRA